MSAPARAFGGAARARTKAGDAIRAVALLSGGLDSMLAARVVADQGVHVEGLNFFTGFCVEGHTHAIRGSRTSQPNRALRSATALGIKLHFIDVVEEYKSVVLTPKHGYGAVLNPCLDCKSFMVAKAMAWMEREQFDFIITGEVLEQRAKSQTGPKMRVVARESGAGDRLLRPLCAQRLPPTLPERMGWVNRDRLHAFHGRSRKPQIALAAALGIEDYAQPAGGCCFLTDVQFKNRLEDLWGDRKTRDYSLDDITLLKVGRHLRPRPHMKLIVGRECGENAFLEDFADRFTRLEVLGYGSPVALLQGERGAQDVRLAAELVARFSQGRDASKVRVKVTGAAERWRAVMPVRPLTPSEIPKTWYL